VFPVAAAAHRKRVSLQPRFLITTLEFSRLCDVHPIAQAFVRTFLQVGSRKMGSNRAHQHSK
jgi:hypothetical protein